MRYHLYFHDDFDGMASGAVMLNFLRSRGDDIISFNPVDYTPKINETWTRYKFKKPFILVDFRYHLEASWWFDHHKSSFAWPVLPAWGKLYKNDKTHFRSPNFASCASMILAHLKKYFGYKPPKCIKELVRWDDTIDGARYKSIKWVIESRGPAMELRIYLFYENNKRKRCELIKNLAVRPMKEIVTDRHIAKKIEEGFKDVQKSIKNLKNVSRVFGKVVFADTTKTSSDVSHYLLYYKYPKAKYSAILESIQGSYHLGIGFNRWQKDQFCADISKILEKYGGGGHRTVGAVEKQSKKEIMKIAEEIIEYLNKSG